MAERFEKWLNEARRTQSGLQTDAVRRETQNEMARAKAQKLDEPKDYEKVLKKQAAKTARLRELRLAKEAQERVDAETRKRDSKPRR